MAKLAASGKIQAKKNLGLMQMKYKRNEAPRISAALRFVV